MKLDPIYLIQAPWSIFILYWIFAGLRVNRIERRGPSGELVVRILCMLLAWSLLYSGEPWFGVLNRRFMTSAIWIFSIGAALAWAGVAFAIWARRHIGRFGSSTVALREGHELIRSGPYARIRHPIYSGMLLAVAGSGPVQSRCRICDHGGRFHLEVEESRKAPFGPVRNGV